MPAPRPIALQMADRAQPASTVPKLAHHVRAVEHPDLQTLITETVVDDLLRGAQIETGLYKQLHVPHLSEIMAGNAMRSVRQHAGEDRQHGPNTKGNCNQGEKRCKTLVVH